MKQEIEIKTKNASEKEAIVKEQLDIALPALEAAKNSVSSISNAALTEIRNLPNPPLPVKTTINAVLCMILLKGQEYEWAFMRKELAKNTFI